MGTVPWVCTQARLCDPLRHLGLTGGAGTRLLGGFSPDTHTQGTAGRGQPPTACVLLGGCKEGAVSCCFPS